MYETYNPDKIYSWTHKGKFESGYLTHYLTTDSKTQAVFLDEASRKFRHEDQIENLTMILDSEGLVA